MTELRRILVEAERAARDGHTFPRFWMVRVCSQPNRVRFINQADHDAALAAWERGKVQPKEV